VRQSSEASAGLVIGEGRLSIEDVAAAARGAPVRLAPSVGPRLARARAAIERLAVEERPIYGLTTGLGAAVDTRLSADDLAAFQRRAVMARAVGVGDLLTTEEVRATLVVRLAGLARGASGISPTFVDTIVSMLDTGVIPQARRIGTLGEADLSPLAQLFLPLAGSGMALWRGELLPGPEALRRAGIPVPPFGAKDGIALINANAFGVALAAMAAHEAALAIEALTVAGALSLEAFRANLSPLEPRLVALRAAPGQADAARRVLALLDGSDLHEPEQSRRVQDPLSFRCLSPVHGVVFDRLAQARAAIEADLDGAGDSPALLGGTDEILSTVNFDTTAIALTLEGLGLAASHAAALSAFRTTKLMSSGVSGLPRFLTPHGGSRTGFATVQKTAAALEAEIRHLALPLGALTMPVADGVEDFAPMTPRIAEKTRAIAQRLALLAAVEFAVAGQALTMRGSFRLGRGTGAAFQFLRAHCPALDDDRPLGAEFQQIGEAILAGELQAVLREPAAS
jgi:histidine ammonia-lyase